MSNTYKTASGFVSWKPRYTRMTRRVRGLLVSADLGCLTFEEAQKQAWLANCVLLVDGQIQVRTAGLASGIPHSVASE